MIRRSPRRLTFASGVALVAVLGLVAGLAGCGGGGTFPNHVDRPQVTKFSPFVSVLDFDSFQQNPTYTNNDLTATVDPNYLHRIVIFFNSEFSNGEQSDGTILDASSIFVGGDPNQGVDPSSLQVLQFIPGTGNVLLPLVKVEVQADRIVCYPAALWTKDPNTGVVSEITGGALADGQYSIGVFENVLNVDGEGMLDAPVFHAFTVGLLDTVAPFVVTSVPTNNAEGVGAGVAPPTPIGAQGVADIRTNIFGPNSPPVIVRFNEPIANNTVQVSNFRVVDAGAFVPGGGAPPQIPPAAGYPRLKSVEDGATLPSNGHEIIWKAETTAGAFPFGTTIQVTVVGSDGGTNGNPIKDLTGNVMENSYTFSFRTVAPPELPQNPFPEYAIYWSSTDRVGTVDTINQQGWADFLFNPLAPQFQNGVPQNVVPDHTDEIANSINIPQFDPTEISVDCRTNGATCHSLFYVISPSSGQVVMINTRTSIPVAILNTPTPGGISNQTGGGQAANVLCVTNSSANTLTVFGLGSVTVGLNYLSGPVTIQKVTTTGNTPRTVSISLSSTGEWRRDPNNGGPSVPLIIYADYTDGVVNTKPIQADAPVRQFNLGPHSGPNDVAMTPCYVPCFNCPLIMYTAISQGGDAPNAGKVAYYVAGPGCGTGSTTPIRPDAIVGDVGGLDGPAGLDEVFPIPSPEYFTVAESGSQANGVTTLTLVVGNPNVPQSPDIFNQFHQLGANPVAVAHRDAILGGGGNWCIGPAGSGTCYGPPPPPGCVYNGAEELITAVDGSIGVSMNMYICARGAGRIVVVDISSGTRDVYSPILIPGVRFVASHGNQ